MLVRNSTVYLEMSDEANQPKTGLTSNSPGLSIVYTKGNIPVQITPVALSSVQDVCKKGGVKEVDSVNLPGLVRFDLPHEVFKDQNREALVTIKATGYKTLNVPIPLVDNRQHMPQTAWMGQTIRTNN